MPLYYRIQRRDDSAPFGYSSSEGELRTKKQVDMFFKKELERHGCDTFKWNESMGRCWFENKDKTESAAIYISNRGPISKESNDVREYTFHV